MQSTLSVIARNVKRVGCDAPYCEKAPV
jgi:hypothetical protein